MLVYLDWNVYDRIEKIELLSSNQKDLYGNLVKFLERENIFVPYSIAHLNDIRRGHLKNPDFSNKHLEVISTLSKNLLLCQYWGKKETTLHYRNPIEFFSEILREDRVTIQDLDNYIDSEEDDHLLKTFFQAQRSSQQMKPIPDWWHSIYKEDPIFSIMYPRTKVEKTEWALTCDLHNWGNIIEKDYSIYKYYKSYVNKMIYMFKKQAKLVKSKTKKINLPKYLEIEEIVDELDRASNIKTPNISYNKIVSNFFKYDIKGYKSDKNYNSMIDDCLHTYYASLCDYFITLDERCNAKAKKTYESLKLKTIVLTPSEFNEQIKTF